jgi:hypothetical protein
MEGRWKGMNKLEIELCGDGYYCEFEDCHGDADYRILNPPLPSWNSYNYLCKRHLSAGLNEMGKGEED